METTFHKRNCLQYIYAMILAKVVLLTVQSLSLDLSHRLSQPWGGDCVIGILYKDHVKITPRSLKVKMVRII